MNNYKFTISPRAKANIQKIIRDANNVSEFLRSEGYLAYDPVSEASTRSLYEAYKDWCEDNAEIMLASDLSILIQIFHIALFIHTFSATCPTAIQATNGNTHHHFS